MTITPRPEVNVVVADSFTKAALSQFTLSEKNYEIRFEGQDKNFELCIKEIEGKIGHALDPLVNDFYRIASALYYCDLQLNRPSKTEGRKIAILISVSDKSKWDAEKEHLEMTMRFLTYDEISFQFVQGQRPQSEFNFTERNSHVISLFSGGLDSLAGVKWLKDKNLHPILVGHTANATSHGAMKTLRSALKSSFGGDLDLISVSSSRTGDESRRDANIQPSRSFLYLTLGCLFALELGIRKAYLFENGVIGLNIPLVQSRIYSHTRTAHPKFISDFNRLIANIFPNTIAIENPFVLMTKGEVVKLLNDPAFGGLVKETITCSRASGQRWSGKKGLPRNCGICLPCIIRRASVHHAGLWGQDSKYISDITGEFSTIPQDGKTLLLQILQFGRKLDKPYDEVLDEIPQFYIEEQNPKDLIDMMRRNDKEILACIKEKGSASLQSNIQSYIR